MVRILLLALVLSPFTVVSQKRYFTEKSLITFFSKGVVEDISAVNAKVTSILDLVNGEVAYLLNPKDFQFDKKLMQIHFNEKYMESEKFPRSTFKGRIVGLNAASSTLQNVRAVGKLTIHGVTRDIDVPGTLHVQGNNVSLKSKFMLKLADYNIKIPQIVWQNIAQQVEVTVDFLYRPVTN